jgi:hypothetical protein
MTAQTTRILKEARPLFWPWCAVALAGVLPLLYPMGWTAPIYTIGFFLVPVMVTLSLGDEFQHRTLSLLLSQPVSRMEIWGEKLGVTVVAVVSAVLLFFLALRATAFHPSEQELAYAGAWIVAITASAAFWTLFTRSSVGGVALNIVVQSILILMVPWTGLAERLRARGYLSPVNTIVVPTVAILCYAGVMLWLSWRTLARFQVAGGMAGDDLLTARPAVMPGAWADWLRCRPSGALFNLVRKELRLLRPLWLIILLAAMGWACLTLFGLFYERGYSRNFETAVVIVGVISTLMVAILAGSLSLGEEKTSGTHAWNLTLPVSARRQWAVKLSVALFAAFVGAGLLPMLTVGRFYMLLDLSLGTRWLLLVLLLTFVAFWCACAVNGTVAAAMWVFPVTVVLGGASYLASQWAYYLTVAYWVSRPSWYLGGPSLIVNVADLRHQVLNLLGNLRFDWWVSSVTNHHLHALSLLFWNPQFYAGLVGGPALILALVQSYRMFGGQARDGARTVLRKLWPLALLVFLCGFSLTAFSALWWGAGSQIRLFNAVTNRAIEKTLPGAAKLHPAGPLQLTGADVVKAWYWPVDDPARRWLSGARITVMPDKAHPNGFLCREDRPGDTWCYYSATIHLADGTDIFQSVEPLPNRPAYFWHYSVRARWPGATREETLWER